MKRRQVYFRYGTSGDQVHVTQVNWNDGGTQFYVERDGVQDIHPFPLPPSDTTWYRESHFREGKWVSNDIR